MGLLDAIFGRKKLPPSKIDRLGSISSAELTLRTQLGLATSGRAGLAIRAVQASHFDRVRDDLAKLLGYASADLGSTAEIVADEYGFQWVIVADSQFTDLVATTQIAAQTIAEEGYRDQLLCAVFHFTDKAGEPLDMVYAFKRASFYAFAPRAAKRRDVSLEIRTHAILQGELPLEKDMEHRYPVWGVPLGKQDP